MNANPFLFHTPSPRRRQSSDAGFIEPLEDRIELAADAAAAFDAAASALDPYLADLAADEAAQVNGVTVPLPLFGTALKDLSKATQAVQEFRTGLINAMHAVVDEATAKTTLFAALGPAGLNVIGDVNGNAAPDVDDITVQYPDGVDDLTVSMRLTKVLSTTTFGFDLGLDGFPLVADASAEVEVELSFDYLLQFSMQNLSPATFAVANSTFALGVAAGLAPGSQLTGKLGFLQFTATDQGTQFTGAFNMARTGNNLGAPSLTGALAVNVLLDAGFDDDGNPNTGTDFAPSIASVFTVDWQFLNEGDLGGSEVTTSFGNEPAAKFDDVKLKLGTFVSDFLGPAVGFIKDLTKPVAPFFALLDEPLPVLSELSDAINLDSDGQDDGYDLLDVVKLADSLGLIPPEYEPLVSLATAIISLTNTINDIDTTGDAVKNLTIDFGEFDVTGGGTDLRALDLPATYGDPNSGTWSNLAVNYTGSLDLSGVKAQITDAANAAGVPQFGDKLNMVIDNFQKTANNGAHLDFPLFDNPANGVFQLLLGHDVDLISFSAQAFATGSVELPGIPVGPVDVTFGGSFTLDAYFRIAYDTYGFRKSLATGDFSHLADGLYLDTGDADGNGSDQATKFSFTGQATATVSVGQTFFEVGVNGGISAAVLIALDNDQNMPGFDGDAAKLRLFNGFNVGEFDDCIITTSGGVSGFLEVFARIGVEVLGEFVGVEFSKTIASVEVVNFDNGCINPFAEPPGLKLASTHADDAAIPEGTLRLNMGHFADARNYSGNHDDPNGPNEPQETFIVAADPENANNVIVSAFGFTQSFAKPATILGYGGGGDDKIVIKGDVLGVDARLYGDDDPNDPNDPAGAGDDVLSYAGDGTALLVGGPGADALTGGSGANFLNGGDGDDDLTGGTGVNTLGEFVASVNGVSQGFFEPGFDRLQGGTGPNTLRGGDGDDELFAGPTDGDVLEGGAGNDHLVATTGRSSFNGGRDDDVILWKFGDGLPILVEGGTDGESNTLAMTGSDAPDTWVLSRNAANKPEVKVLAPGLSTKFLTSHIQEISIEGLRGADMVTVNPLTGTSVLDVGVNLGDVLADKSALGDGVADIVIVNGSAVADVVTVSAEQAAIQKVSPRDFLLGGIMKVAGMPTYDVRMANVSDDVRFHGMNGPDVISITSDTGPTLLQGGGGNDFIHVLAAKLGDPVDPTNPNNPKDYLSSFTIDAGAGINKLHIDEELSEIADTIAMSSTFAQSLLLPGVSFTATGGSFKGGVTLTGSAFSDTINLTSTLSGVTTTINGRDGNDTISVGSAAPSKFGNLNSILGPLTVDAGPGSGNLLRLLDFSDSTGNGAVIVTANKVAGFAGPSDNMIVTYSATFGDLALLLEGSNTAALNEKFRLVSPDAKVTVNGNAGNDTIDIPSLTEQATINGGNGNEIVNVGATFNQLDAVTAPIFFKGEGGTDVLNLLDGAAAGAQAYTILPTALGRSNGVGAVVFDASLETANLTATKFNDSITAGGTPVVGGFINVAAGLGSDEMLGGNSLNIWNLTAPDAGNFNAKVKFTSVQKLTGGPSSDRFNLLVGGKLTGSINGGAGADRLDYGAYSAAVTFNLQTGTAPNIAGFGGIEGFTGGTGSDTLIGLNFAALWKLTGGDSGTIDYPIGSFNFTALENLIGGSAPEIFETIAIGPLPHKLNVDAGGGLDTLAYPTIPTAVLIDLLAGVATGFAGITNFENATGGLGDDTLIGNGLVNVLSGGAGNDIIVGNDNADTIDGGLGRDVLIGGAGADNVSGGLGDDIMIGGTTDHDANVSALAAILAEWTSGNSYDQRTINLRNGTGLNAPTRLSANEWDDDNVADMLTGGADTDWFFAILPPGANADITDLTQPPERNM